MPTEVVENGVTITASASEAEIRESAGFTESPKAPDGHAPQPGAPAADSANSGADPATAASATSGDATERNPDGTFKPKPQSGDPRKSMQARLNAEVAKTKAAEARAHALEAQLAAGSTPKAPAVGDAPPAPQATPKPPTHLELVKQYQNAPDWPGDVTPFIEAGFADPYAAMLAAQSAYMADKQWSDRDAQSKQAAKDSEAHDRVRTAYDEAAEKYPDWNDLMASEAAQVVLPAAIVNELYADPALSADLMHLLLTNPDDVLRLSQVHDPIAAAREVTKLSMRLTAAPAGPAVLPPPQTRAKPLIKPVSASPAAPEAVPPEDLEFGPKYIAAMNAKERKAKEASRA